MYNRQRINIENIRNLWQINKKNSRKKTGKDIKRH